LKALFGAHKLPQLWLLAKYGLSSLDKAIKVLPPSVTTYLCETGLCAFAVMKTNYQSGLIMEKEL
jgi:hypothetical protein